MWIDRLRGNFFVTQAWDSCRVKGPKVTWFNHVWNSHIPLRIAGTEWKLLNSCAATDNSVQLEGIRTASVCELCHKQTESYIVDMPV